MAPAEEPNVAARAKAYQATKPAEFGTLPDGVGIAVGQRAPAFELPAVEGGTVSLSALLAKPEVLLDPVDAMQDVLVRVGVQAS